MYRSSVHNGEEDLIDRLFPNSVAVEYDPDIEYDLEDIDDYDIDGYDIDDQNKCDVGEYFDKLESQFELKEDYSLDNSLFELPFNNMDKKQLANYKLMKDSLNSFEGLPMIKFPNCSFMILNNKYYKITYSKLNLGIEINRIDSADIPHFVKRVLDCMRLLLIM